jgi:uroporphyrinogen-III decarboxylase
MGATAPFAKLPHLSSFSMLATGMGVPFFHSPELVDACKGIYKASREIGRVWDARTLLVNEMQALGYPGIYQMGGGGGSPFESLADNYRGLRGIMLDMYQRPDKLLAAIEKLNEISRRNPMRMKPFGGNNLAWSALLRGADNFMSNKNFEKFYWPYIKTGIENSINMGFTPIILWEGDCTSRLEYLLDLPKGKIIHRFDRTDIFRAKEILGGHSCIAGGISAPMLATGSVQDVKDQCKKLIDTVGKNGGFILSHSCQMDNLRAENMKEMIDFTREYGVYK